MNYILIILTLRFCECRSNKEEILSKQTSLSWSSRKAWLKITTLFILFPLSPYPPKKREKRKGESIAFFLNFKSCLSARSSVMHFQGSYHLQEGSSISRQNLNVNLETSHLALTLFYHLPGFYLLLFLNPHPLSLVIYSPENILVY